MSRLIQQSSFCKNCENFMDITNNISIIDTDKIGGGIGGDGVIEDFGEIPTESSDYDVSMRTDGIENNNSLYEAGTGAKTVDGEINLSDNNLNDILNGSDVEFDVKNLNINNLNKNPTFNKLTNLQKTLVINRILEKIPKNKTKQSENIVKKDSYYYCRSCGYTELIPHKQFIFSRGDEKNDDFYNYKFKNYIHDNTLPRTKKYNCINDKCPTHQNPSSKIAVFYRQKNSYNVRYICGVCESFWNTFVEK